MEREKEGYSFPAYELETNVNLSHRSRKFTRVLFCNVTYTTNGLVIDQNSNFKVKYMSHTFVQRSLLQVERKIATWNIEDAFVS